MTILIDTMKNAATAAAVRAGKVWLCSKCNGEGTVYSGRDGHRDHDCPACDGAGERHYHYVGRAMPRRGVKASALGNPFVVGKDGTADECLEWYNYRVRAAALGNALITTAREAKPRPIGGEIPEIPAIQTALDAIRADLRLGRTVVLVCWCAKCRREAYDNPADHADGCHADIVAKLVKEMV